MGWDKKGARAYYYRTVREGGKVRKVYVGQGRQAEELAREVEHRRLERQAEREARQRDQAQVLLAEQMLAELRALTEVLVRLTMDAAGYHQHKGQWRRRRCQGRPR